MTYYNVNEYQTPITDELFQNLPEEVKEQFFDFYENVEFIRILTDPNRPHARDLNKDSEGRIIVDITHPHILEDMDYFRQPALHYQKYGCYTTLKPNSNPNSEYRKYWDEEWRRCLEGYVRPTDGEWVTGMMYWFMNYTPMMINKIIKGTTAANRVEGFPLTWEGIYWRFHYLQQARWEGHNAIELAKRSVAKSYSLASIMTHNLILGENLETRKRNIVVLAASSKEYIKEDKDGSLSKFVPMLNFVLDNTPFPRLFRKKSSNDMSWVMGYESNGVVKGSGNTVMAVSTKDDSDKLRGKRGWILYEEMGNYKNLLSVYDSVMRSTMEGNYSYALQYLVGTSNNKEADFQAAKTLLYKPEGYNIKALPNVYDRKGEGKPTFGFFFPAYVNRLGCYDENGNSDVVKALIEILVARYEAKHSADPQTVLTRIAEDPITPAEAMIKVKAAFFPVQQINERIRQLELENILDTNLVGTLVNVGSQVKFIPTNDIPIRSYTPNEVDNTEAGAIEIYIPPETDSSGKVPSGRYIIGHDPVDNDQADSQSLSCTLVFDTWTDELVAEYTGRQPYADDNFEILRKLCIYYNAKCLYESNIKGCFAYFKKMGCVEYLADTPQYLRDKNLIKYTGWGSSAKGVSVSAALNNYANGLINDWLKKPMVTTEKNEDGELEEYTTLNLYKIKAKALLEELAAFRPEINVDRVRCLGLVMILREEALIACGGDLSKLKRPEKKVTKADDDYFTKNWNKYKKGYNSKEVNVIATD